MGKTQWSKLDYFLPMALVKEKAALTDLVGGKVAVNNGATKIFEGFDFSVSNSITANYNPSLNGINYKLNDASFGAFCKTTTSVDSFYIAGGNESRLWDQSGSDRLRSRINTTANANNVPKLQQNELVFLSRLSVDTVRYARDGVESGDLASTSTEVDITSFFIGGSAFVGNYEGIISLFSLGAGIGIDQVAKNDHYRQFLEDLGINLSLEENKLAGATITDTLQGATGTDELKAT